MSKPNSLSAHAMMTGNYQLRAGWVDILLTVEYLNLCWNLVRTQNYLIE